MIGATMTLAESPVLSALLASSNQLVRRVALRALKSTGWMVQQNWRLYFRSPSWAALSPMTKALGGSRAGLKFLRQFVRYKAFADQMAVAIGFGKGKSRSKKLSDGYTGVGQFGLVADSLLEADPVVSWIAQKAEYGWHGQITEKMRGYVAAITKARSKAKRPKVGRNYYAFGRDKAFINVPARPVAAPYFARIMPKVPEYFCIKFAANWRKLMEGKVAA
jgi:hypothetical protein